MKAQKIRWALFLRHIYFVLIYGLVINQQFVSAEKNSILPSNCELKVGWESWPPYQYLSPTGELKGVHIDLLKRIARQANCQLEFVESPFSKSLNAVKVGKLDMISNTTINADRKQFANFTIPYRTEMMVLYVKAERLQECKSNSFKKLISRGFRFGAAGGNIYGPEMSELQRNQSNSDRIVYLASNREAFFALLDNRVDGYFDDPTVHAYDKRTNQAMGNVKACKIVKYAEDVSLMFSKLTVDKNIIARFNRAIESVKSSEYYKNTWQWTY